MMMEADDYLLGEVMPLGKGTCGLGAESDRAVRAYQRETHKAWRRSKRSQNREKVMEEERLMNLVAGEAAVRKKVHEEEQVKKAIAAEKQVAKRREHEKVMAEMVERRRQEWKAMYTQERVESKTRRQKQTQERRERRERDVYCMKVKREKERAEWQREIQTQQKSRVNEVNVLKKQADESKQRKDIAVAKARSLRLVTAKEGKLEQVKKEEAKQVNMQANHELLVAAIKHSVEVHKQKRTDQEEEKHLSLHYQMEARKKEDTTLRAVIEDRRTASYEAARELHNKEWLRETQKRRKDQASKSYFYSSLFRGHRTPGVAEAAQMEPTSPVRPVSAPPSRSGRLIRDKGTR